MATKKKATTKKKASKKTTELHDLPTDRASADVTGGRAGRLTMKAPACSTGLLSTCKVNDTLESWCAC